MSTKNQVSYLFVIIIIIIFSIIIQIKILEHTHKIDIENIKENIVAIVPHNHLEEENQNPKGIFDTPSFT
jgi:hypothetical protein